MTRHGRLTTIIAGLIAVAILTGFAFTTAVASTSGHSVHMGSNYDDQIAAANKEKTKYEKQLESLNKQLEDTNAALIEADRALLEMQAKLPGLQKELTIANERLNAALVQQKIVAEKLKAAKQLDASITQDIADDEQRIADLKIALGVLARDQYMSEGTNDSLALVFGAKSSTDFVNEFAAQHSASRVQTNALDEIQQIAATNRNRGARQEAVRGYIEELKKQADALVVEANTAQQLAQQKKDEVAANLAAQKKLKAQLETQKAAALDQQKKIEDAQKKVQAEILALVKKKLAEETRGNPTPIGKGYLSFPTKVPYITSSYGWRYHPILHYYRMHYGTDFRAYCGTPIYAAAEGKVLWAKYRYGFGNQVMLDHGIVNGNSLMTSYNHLSKFNVSDGQYVTRGTIVGYSGTGGLSTGCHLHFEVYVNGKNVDPMSILGPIP